jgi:hypothetical protein
MKKEISEITAMQEIDSCLSQLQPEEQLRVFNWISSKYKFGSSGKFITSPSSGISKMDNTLEDSGMHIKDFIAAKKPENNYEKIACVAFFLEKFRGMDSFKTVEITKGFQDARLNKMSNPAMFVAETARAYGYLTSIGSAKKGLTARGEALVNALPIRENVTAALTEFPFKKGGKKNVVKKKKK